MKKQSAGILLFRRPETGLQVLLVHPGGPFWARKDVGAWSIPKGEYAADEEPLLAAKREFQEETGFRVDGNFLPLGEVKQSGGKTVTAWALEHDLDPTQITSNTFQMEWPPRSKTLRDFPEVDAAAWFSRTEAQVKMLPAQLPFVTRLEGLLSTSPEGTN